MNACELNKKNVYRISFTHDLKYYIINLFDPLNIYHV